ncbi:ATPase-like protein, partial [Candidatus Thiomargarita nelsonii]
MLKNIKIQGYKSLYEVDINLSALVVLFGPNAAGKSNFLDALLLLSRIATKRSLSEAFTPPYRGNPLESFTFDAIGIKGLLAKDKASFSIEVEVALSPSVIDTVNRQIQRMAPNQITADKLSESDLRYRIEIDILPKSGLLRVADESLVAINGKTPLIEKKAGQLYLHSEAPNSPNAYELYLDHSLLSLPLYPPHYPHLVALRQELESWLFFYFEPRQRMRAKNPVKEVHHIGLMGEELAAFLNTLRSVDER